MSYQEVAILIVILILTYCNAFDISGRIIGGDTADIQYSNYQVSVREFDEHICGGSIISANTVLTAAHCTEGSYAANMSIRHGDTIADNGIKHQVSKIIPHPKYNTITVENDICLLKLSSAIEFSNLSRPIKLSTKRLIDGTHVKITGWGKSSISQPNNYNGGSRPMRYVIVKVINQTVCRKDYASIDIKIDSRMMCAAAKGKDSCQGDSGGPLVSGNGDAREQVGICSQGMGCADERYPGIYTLVAAYSDFIRKNL